MADIATTTFLCSTALSALSLTSLTTAHLCGVDFNAVIAFIVKHVPALDAVASKLDPALGTVAAILIVHKLWAPIRWSMAAAATPFFLPLYRRKLKPWWKKVVHNWRAGKK
jgi:predicted branched-subunit amino acid permease